MKNQKRRIKTEVNCKEEHGRPKCSKCGRSHEAGKCPASKWRCYKCQKVGHVKKLCPVKGTSKAQGASAVGVVEEEDQDEEVNSDLFNLHTVSASKNTAHRVKLMVNDKLIDFEVDTGACKSIISGENFKKWFNVSLKPVAFKLNAVSGQDIKALGVCDVNVRFRNKIHCLSLTVIDSKKEFTPLLGRNWLYVLFPDWKNSFCINQVKEGTSSFLKEMKTKFNKVFNSNLCQPIKNFEVKFMIKENVVPVVKKAYAMPYALKP